MVEGASLRGVPIDEVDSCNEELPRFSLEVGSDVSTKDGTGISVVDGSGSTEFLATDPITCSAKSGS